MDAQRIERLLDDFGANVGRPLTVCSETGSTNDDAKAAAARGASHGALFVADAQTAGRGRGGKAWHSPPGENLYLSLLLRPELPPERLAPLSLVAGVAVARVVDGALAEPRATLKWPNDVYVDAHKIAGILVESTPSDHGIAVVIGIGLNVLGRRFPEGFVVPPISLDIAGATELGRETLCAKLVGVLGALTAAYVERGLSLVDEELRGRDFLHGRSVAVGDLRGRADGIAADGSLRLIDAAGAAHAIISGEVRWTP